MRARSVCCSRPASCRPVEQRQAVLEAMRQLLQWQRADPGCRQLDRKRQPVETPTDLADDAEGSTVGDEVVALQGGPLNEQLDGIAILVGRRHWVPGVGQRRDSVDPLAADTEWLPAGGQDPHMWAASQESSDQFGSRDDDMLAVVQQDQRGPRDERVDEPIDSSRSHAKRFGEAAGDLPAIGQCCQLDHPHTVVDLALQRSCHRHSQPGLAGPAGTGHRGQTRSRHEVMRLATSRRLPMNEVTSRASLPARPAVVPVRPSKPSSCTRILRSTSTTPVPAAIPGHHATPREAGETPREQPLGVPPDTTPSSTAHRCVRGRDRHRPTPAARAQAWLPNRAPDRRRSALGAPFGDGDPVEQPHRRQREHPSRPSTRRPTTAPAPTATTARQDPDGPPGTPRRPTPPTARTRRHR